MKWPDFLTGLWSKLWAIWGGSSESATGGVAATPLRPTDLLGRRVSSSTQAKKAARSNDPKVDFRVFMGEDDPSISTDRLGLAADAIIATIADSEIPAGSN